MRFKAVIFDLDGTLLNTLQDLAECTNTALSELGCPIHPVESYKDLIGAGTDSLIRSTLPEGQRDDETVARCRRIVLAEYRQRWPDHTRPYPGIQQMLQQLQGRSVPMAVFTNKPDELTQDMVAELLKDFCFAVVLGARPVIPRKPAPAGALYIAKQMHTDPAEFLYVGDTHTDMETAIAAGMFPVGVLWGFRGAEELTRSGARALISDPSELLPLLGPQQSLTAKNSC